MRSCIYLLLLLSSCATIYQPRKTIYYDYRIHKIESDAGVISILKPYSDSINKVMNIVVGVTSETLEKKQPNGSLGLVLVQAMQQMAAVKYNTKVDAAFINNGGIRIPTLAKGNVTVGKVYEIMPFDNLLILQTISGKTLQDFIDLIARKGGWPVSGITFTIASGKATQVLVGGKPIDPLTMYTIANSDYIANGGDDADMLRPVPQRNDNVLLRDIFIEFFKMKYAAGELIEAPKELPIQKL